MKKHILVLMVLLIAAVIPAAAQDYADRFEGQWETIKKGAGGATFTGGKASLSIDFLPPGSNTDEILLVVSGLFAATKDAIIITPTTYYCNYSPDTPETVEIPYIISDGILYLTLNDTSVSLHHTKLHVKTDGNTPTRQ